MIMRTNLEDGAEECLYTSELPMVSTRVSGDDILLVTDNCPGSLETCWEGNVFNPGSGVFTQLTHFGTGSMIFSHWIEGNRIILERHATVFPYIHEAHVGVKTPDPLCGTLSHAGGLDSWINLTIVLFPLTIVPWLHRHRIRRKPSEAS
jgi:hypothetical protein